MAHQVAEQVRKKQVAAFVAEQKQAHSRRLAGVALVAAQPGVLLLAYSRLAGALVAVPFLAVALVPLVAVPFLAVVSVVLVAVVAVALLAYSRLAETLVAVVRSLLESSRCLSSAG